jgi:hypothetical protein
VVFWLVIKSRFKKGNDMDFEAWWKENGNNGYGEYVLAQKAFAAALVIEREACVIICETLPLIVANGMYQSQTERHVMLVTEVGCRGAFSKAIRRRSAV